MKLLVAGGAGFIGSNFIRQALMHSPSVEIVNFDLLTYAGNLASLNDVSDDPRYEFVHGDIADSKAVREAMRDCDAVVNFAAESHVDRSIIDASIFVKTNVLGVQVMLDAAREFGVERFLHVSTDETYGSIEKGSFREDDRLQPNSPYAASKAASDLIVRSYFVTHGVPTIVTRSSNNYGPYQFPEKLIPLFVTNLIEGRSVPVYGDGLNVRDWTYVEDNCSGLLTVLESGSPGEIYNIGAGDEIPNIDVTRALLEVFGVGDEVIRHVPDRPGHDLRYSISTEKVRALGWEPAVSFPHGLRLTVDWFRDNEAWWRPLLDGAASAALPETVGAQARSLR